MGWWWQASIQQARNEVMVLAVFCNECSVIEVVRAECGLDEMASAEGLEGSKGCGVVSCMEIDGRGAGRWCWTGPEGSMRISERSVESVEEGRTGRSQEGRHVAETPGGREEAAVASMTVNQEVGVEERVR